jgi:hypothetical protein
MARKPEPPEPKILERFFAARRRSGGIKLAKYVLCPFGLASDTVGDITLDGTIALIQPHPYGEICLCPLTGKPQPTESVAWYYADCIAYEHDIPVIVLPTGGDFHRFGYRYAHGGPIGPQERFVFHGDSGRTTKYTVPAVSVERVVKQFYGVQLCSILAEIRELRQGPLTFVCFRHGSAGGKLDLPYSVKYASAAQEVHLYAVALRQADALGEFLCYYRVIESATRSNGKVWVAAALDRLRSHDFGRIPIAHQQDPSPRNLLAIWRRRVLRRVSTLLREHGSPSEIAKYLYHTNRCGIAHGSHIIRANITPSYFEVVRDAYLLKLLARLAIDEKLQIQRVGTAKGPCDR